MTQGAYAIKDFRGQVMLPYIRRSKRLCIRAIVENTNIKWPEHRRNGFSCVMVSVTEL